LTDIESDLERPGTRSSEKRGRRAARRKKQAAEGRTAASAAGTEPKKSRRRERQGTNRNKVVFLHIGTVKSGTTYLQSVLRANPEALRAAEVRYPYKLQVAAARDVVGMPDSAGQVRPASWQQLLDYCMRRPGHRALVSMEFLSFAAPDQVKSIVDSFDGAEVHVILTARDLLRVVPSAWQNAVKNGRQWTFKDYVTSVMEETTDGERTPSRHFWHRHDVAAVCRRWIDVVGPEHFHLITVPPSGASPDALWERFAGVVGLDPTAFNAKDLPPANTSLNLVEAEFMLRLLPHLPRSTRSARILRGTFANKLVRGSSDSKLKLKVPREVQEWAVQRSRQTVAELAELGMDVVGSLDELIPVVKPDADDVDSGPVVTSADLAATGVRAAAALLEEVIRQYEKRSAGKVPDLDDNDLALEAE
jgi:hypothetical protein